MMTFEHNSVFFIAKKISKEFADQITGYMIDS